MYALDCAAPTAPTATSWRRSTGRWMVTFVGFPLGGVAAELVVGPVNSLRAALMGGLITGAVLGAVQVWGLGRGRPPAAAWIAATAIGLMVGLGIGAPAVGYGTTLTALVVQGAIGGFVLGAAQALVLRPRLGWMTLAWPVVLAAVWAIGWAVTTAIGVQVDEQFTVFGSSGALVVTALTAALPIMINRTEGRAS